MRGRKERHKRATIPRLLAPPHTHLFTICYNMYYSIYNIASPVSLFIVLPAFSVLVRACTVIRFRFRVLQFTLLCSSAAILYFRCGPSGSPPLLPFILFCILLPFMYHIGMDMNDVQMGSRFDGLTCAAAFAATILVLWSGCINILHGRTTPALLHARIRLGGARGNACLPRSRTATDATSTRAGATLVVMDGQRHSGAFRIHRGRPVLVPLSSRVLRSPGGCKSYCLYRHAIVRLRFC